VVLAGLNAENEILHTLAFLAGVMIWSQVSMSIDEIWAPLWMTKFHLSACSASSNLMICLALLSTI
jgi:hypothetical protein